MKNEENDYFAPISKDEDSPVRINIEDSLRYSKLEEIFNSFFPSNYYSIAKEKSRKERDDKHINDSSFTYGEIVYIHLYNDLIQLLI